MRSIVTALSLVTATAGIFSQSATAEPDSGGSTCSGPAGPLHLSVAVENVRSTRGEIAVTLYPDDPNRFLAHHGSLYVARVPARTPVTRLCINIPAPGDYAVAVYHDEDGNRKLTRGLGLPTEGFGFSNNPATAVGLPAFASVRMPVPRNNLKATIRLTYP